MSIALYEKICSTEALISAWHKIKQKGSAGGIDEISIEKFENHLSENIEELSYLLSNNRYIPEPYKEIKIPKNEKEFRTLSLPTIRDKIVQQAVKEVIEPILDKEFIIQSFAYRPQKGPLRAIEAVKNLIFSQKRSWATICDINSYFDTIDHKILFSLLAERIKDERILSLIRLWVKMGRVDDRLHWKDIKVGIPQGSIISPILANLYLHPFDKLMIEKRFGYIRYADNFIILSYSETEAKKALRIAKSFLKKRLHLKLNPDYQIKNISEGFNFLGIFFNLDGISLSEKKFSELKEKILNAIKTTPFPKKLCETLEGINRYYAKLIPQNILEELDKWLTDNLKEYIKNAYQNNIFQSKEEIKNLLKQIPFLSSKYQLFKNREIKKIIKVCKKGEKIKLSYEIKKTDPIKQKKREYQKLQMHSSELIITRPGLFVGKARRGMIYIKEKGKKIYKTPSRYLKHISIISPGVTISSDLIHHCAIWGIPIDFFELTGKPYAKIYQHTPTIVDIQLAQLKAFENGKAISLAKTFVFAKIKNQINLMKYYSKYRKKHDKDFAEIFTEKINHMQKILKEIQSLNETDLDILRGKLFSIEGRAATDYWALVERLLNEQIQFEGRIRKGATDLVNSLLNYGYGILYSRIWHTILVTGLNPYISYLHKPQKDKPTLIFDLIEEFRHQIVDKAIFPLITKGKDLKIENGLLSKETRQKVTEKVLERINDIEVFRGKEMKMLDIIAHQAEAMADFLLDKTKKYRPYIAKW